ncbi:MAG: DUF4433 domain-containing protein [Anaerolineaceae bacterium]|nr:DUF4433 domain-containing protein [Anaerolineaceae bacterium]
MKISEGYQNKTGKTYLYDIAHVQNVSSILRFGILSKNLISSRKISYCSLVDESMQSRRNTIEIPNGLLRANSL